MAGRPIHLIECVFLERACERDRQLNVLKYLRTIPNPEWRAKEPGGGRVGGGVSCTYDPKDRRKQMGDFPRLRYAANHGPTPTVTSCPPSMRLHSAEEGERGDGTT